MPDLGTRSALLLQAIVRDGQRAFLTRSGRFERLLVPGLYRFFDPMRTCAIEIFDVAGASFPMDRIAVLQTVAPDVVAENFVIARAEQDEIVFVILDGVTKYYATFRNPLAFWKSVTDVRLERVNIKDSLRADPALVDRHGMAKSPIVLDEVIESHETGLLSVDGVQTERLGPGRHVFWQVAHKVTVRKFDSRPKPLEIAAQEILTKDKVALRVTLTVFWRVIAPEQAHQAAEDVGNRIYRLAQFAIREAVVARTLDEILAERDPMSKEVFDFLATRGPDLGVSFGDVGVKDIILPGEIRALVNKVVEAERTARANLIRRQEETAATRSLLNTARLLENNPLMLRLKELETLEKLVEKVGRLEVVAGPGLSGFDGLLNGLFNLRGGARETPPSEAPKAD